MIAVIGAGNMGCGLGGLMLERGLDARVFHHRPKQLPRVEIGNRIVAPKLGSSTIGEADIALFCVKSYQLSGALDMWLPRLPSGCVVASISNGWNLPVVDRYRSQAAKAALVFRVGISNIGMRSTAESLRVVNPTGLLTWGSVDEQSCTDYEREVFGKMPGWSWADDALAVVRRKWLFNSSLNCFIAANGLSLNGDVLKRAEDLRALFSECYELGVDLWGAWPHSSEHLFSDLHSLVDETSENENSMAADLRLGRRVEVERLLGIIPEGLRQRYPLVSGTLDRIASAAPESN